MTYLKAVSMQKLVLLIVAVNIFGAVIEQVDDNDLVHVLLSEENVVVLFTKPDCHECTELEIALENSQKDLKEGLGAVVVKAENSNLVSIYDPSKEPALIFFRKGIPLLYYGAPSEEEIVQTFIENRDPVVKELSDENFEHLTQASTGATTGDWFIFFYSADCVLCQRHYAVWEAVGAKLKHRLNVARVNRLDAGISTAKRFGVTKSPEFIFLRHGKIYRYKTKDYSIKSFVEFAELGYTRQTHPEVVPPIRNYMDELFSGKLNVLFDSPKLLILVSICFGLILLVGILRNCKTLPSKRTENKSKKAK